MIPLNQKSYIAGEWVSPDGKSFSSLNPRTGETVATYASSGAAEAEQALAAAREAYGEYRLLGGKAIAGFLSAIADEIERLGEGLLETSDRETGLGIPRLTGERARTCGQIRAFARLAEDGQWVGASIDTAQPDRQPAPKPDIRRMLRPIGPVAVFGASNFPFAFGAMGGDTASALAAGNPVVVKGHSFHPATNELFAQAVDKAIRSRGMPRGVFSLLLGNGHELGAALVKHPFTQAVGFTGSLKGGRTFMDLAAAREVPIPVFTEMGSINPVFVCAGALKSRAESIASGLSASATLGTGQFCTSPGVVVAVKNATFAAFENGLREKFAEKPRGVLLHSRIGKAFAEAVGEAGQHSGVDVLTLVDDPEVSVLTPPNVVLRTPAKTFLSNRKLSEEIFGPAVLLVVCDDAGQMREVARNLAGNLTATIQADGDDRAQVAELLEILEQKAGRVIVNGYPTGVEVCPSMQHGGPYPAASLAFFTSVGEDAILRFARPVAYQGVPNALLPEALRDENPHGIFRKVNGKLTREPVKTA
ncbi:MAG: aldehyde dehydrogenase (NADP(+)) [Fibrobacteres bacterium]|nr:aldehyde dehydrogenase (NADP(+)) [Fibrobacterota bacterium]